MKDTILNSLVLSITDDETDHFAQVSDIALSLLTNEYLPQLNIPFVSAVVSAYKIGTTIFERHHIEKLVFIY